MFTFNDEIENSVWEINFKIVNEQNIYNASEIGYLMWTFARALECLDDIEVQLTGWGEGSRCFNFKAIIKSQSAKIDFREVLNDSRQAIEMAVTSTSTDQQKKFQAEKSKLYAEAQKFKEKRKI